MAVRAMGPPRNLSIASSDGAYYRFAKRYREILAASGIELEVIETAGSVENLGLLLSADLPEPNFSGEVTD